MAFATPSRVRNSTCNCSTSSTRPSTGIQAPLVSRTSTSAVLPVPTVIATSSAQSRIEGIAHDIAQHDEGQDRQGQEQAGEQQYVWRDSDQSDTGSLRNLSAPRDHRRHQANTEEGQRRLDSDEHAEV